MNATQMLTESIKNQYYIFGQNEYGYTVIHKAFPLIIIIIIAWIILSYLWLFKCRKIFFPD